MSKRLLTGCDQAGDPARFSLQVDGREPARVGIVTMTRARTSAEAQSLLKALRRLVRLRLPTWIGEGGSPPDFVARLQALPGTHVLPPVPATKPALVNQVRAGFAQAAQSEVEYVLYTEPDKRAFFDAGVPLLLEALHGQNTPAPGLVLAARTERGFATFPMGQRVAETFMNRICSEALGQPGDFTYGPMLVHRRLFQYMQVIPKNLGWGWRFFLIAVAHQLRLRIELCTVATECPRSQRSEDDSRARDYRLRQLIQNVTGLANGWTCLLDHELDANQTLIAAA